MLKERKQKSWQFFIYNNMMMYIKNNFNQCDVKKKETKIMTIFHLQQHDDVH